MFDPTIFENLKVGFENHIYDLDNLDGQLSVINRVDELDMAIMARKFGLKFTLVGYPDVAAQIILQSTVKDLADEILEAPGENPGCVLSIQYEMQVRDILLQCGEIQKVLEKIWEPEIPPVQKISYRFGQEPVQYWNQISMGFNRKINEEQMNDIPHLIDHVLRTLDELNRVSAI